MVSGIRDFSLNFILQLKKLIDWKHLRRVILRGVFFFVVVVVSSFVHSTT